VDKDVEESQSQNGTLRDKTCDWPPLESRAIKNSRLTMTIQPVPYPPGSSGFKSFPSYFGFETIVPLILYI